MPVPLIRYDASLMLDRATKNGLSFEVYKELAPRLQRAKKKLLQDWKSGQQGWLGCSDQAKLVQQIEKLVASKKKFRTCLVIGIGGSDLGARAMYQALRGQATGMKLEFLGANTDPDEVSEVLARVDLKTTLVNIISKSGDTIEPMSSFAIVWEALQKAVGKKASQQVIATTDQEQGSLHAFAVKQGIEMLPVPKNIGGRFSVLSAVGLFPLACAGISIKQLLSGAKQQRDIFQKHSFGGEAAQFAALHVLAMLMQQRFIHVLMPYSSKLESIGKWYRQLWAESLGKKFDIFGKIQHTGPTPIAALGATDQHSQIQLYMEGPQDKVITFIEVSRFQTKQKIPKTIRDFPALHFLTGRDLSEVIHAERAATAKALSEAERPNGTITLQEISPASLGALILFFEIATGIAGDLLDVNPYDQPGVEAGKKAMYAILKS